MPTFCKNGETCANLCSNTTNKTQPYQPSNRINSDNIKRGSRISLSWFSCGFSILVELEFGDVGFCEGGKTGEPGTLEQSENHRQNQPTYDTGSESNPGHICGRGALSPLYHPYSPNSLSVVDIHIEATFYPCMVQFSGIFVCSGVCAYNKV